MLDGFAALQRRDLAEAARLAQSVLGGDPKHPDGLHLMALVLREQGNLPAALDHFERALERGRANHSIHANLGALFRVLGRLNEAFASLSEAVRLRPTDALVQVNLGGLLQTMGDLPGAEAAFREAIRLAPTLSHAHAGLGMTLIAAQRPDEAEAALTAAMQGQPSPDAYLGLGQKRHFERRYEEALALYRQAEAAGSTNVVLFDSLGWLLATIGHLDEAREYMRRALELAPSVERRLQLELMLAPIQPSLEAMHAAGAGFDAAIDRLIQDAGPVSTVTRQLFAGSVFYLANHGHDVRPTMEKLARLYEKLHPALLQQAPHIARPRRAGPLRVGFLSQFINDHPVTHCSQGLVEALSQDARFEVSLISLQSREAAQASGTYSAFQGRFVHLPDRHPTAVAAVAELELDVLVYLDIGMDETSYFLAFSRLARVQCVMGGHPVTTGIRNVDVFISTDVAEPPGAEAHYSERLVRLRSVPVDFRHPLLPAAWTPREKLGLPAEGALYVCPMMLQKIHPDFDRAMGEILRLDPTGHVILFARDRFWRGLLEERFKSTVPEAVRSRLLFVPYIADKADFLSVNAHASVVLDPFHFGIGSTAISVFAVGTPIVTLAGRYLRSRAGTMYCKVLDLPECITTDAQSYVETAVAIARDPARRERLSRTILANKHRLFDNVGAIPEFADALIALAEGRPAGATAAPAPRPAVIPVTRPQLPPLEQFEPMLRQIWDSRILTNGGPFHQQLEQALCEHLGVKHIALFANATIALVTALQALRITGEVITTPFSFVATSHALLWNGIRPVFADVDPLTLNLDPARIEAAITPQTTAILPVHVYGTPCDVEQIQRIADTYNLKVIYDAAHAFGVDCHCGSVLQHGDLSVLSFHATKVFNTFEGGAIVCPDAKTKQRIDHLKNFGFADEVTVVAPGINGKMNEFSAALGLLQLRSVDAAIAERAEIDARYRSALAGLRGIACPPVPQHARHNHAYFPIRVTADCPIERDALYQHLRERDILVRRYFHPLISHFPMYRGLPSSAPENLPAATAAAREVLCLPIYPGLSPADQARITDAIAEAVA